MGADGISDGNDACGVDLERRCVRDQLLQRSANIVPNARPSRTDFTREAVVHGNNGIASCGEIRSPTLILPLRAMQPSAAVQAEECGVRTRACRQIDIDAKSLLRPAAVRHVAANLNTRGVVVVLHGP